MYIGVGFGGIIGSLLRYFLSAISGEYFIAAFPMGTLTANLAGSYVLGWLTSNLFENRGLHPVLVAGIGTGVIGSFTTFSSFALESVLLFESGKYAVALIYVLLSSGGGVFLAALGYKAGLRASIKRGENVKC
ncbi:fluoride efflux transporter CrcB [Bacillus sp. T33-2]|uniref:fluoride efflux transporter CrcB n=1 Tax=Bacillus sp. T33-2 TaxID=2054168 RepID=UPI0021553C6E|nr:fluoride efflux transporter CrcB [Bacillus sp. T33-2]